MVDRIPLYMGGTGVDGNTTVTFGNVIASVDVVSSNAFISKGTIFNQGGQITFPSTQIASSDINTLDDYEEGTWTPVLFGVNTAGTYSYLDQAGTYIKVGQTVFFECVIRASSEDSAPSGIMEISGLPFSKGTQLGNLAGFSFGYVNNWAGTTKVSLGSYINSAASTITLVKMNSGATIMTQMLHTDMTGNIQFYISGTYRASA